MNTALIIAGGSSHRMNLEIPKQFLQVEDKPIIIYTLESVQTHSEINSIFVVCLDTWHEFLQRKCEEYGISKLAKIVSGGETRHESVYNGLSSMKYIAEEDDIIVVIDANKPMISHDIITDNIEKCKKYDAAMSVLPCINSDSMYISENGEYVHGTMPREILYRGSAPESVKYKKLLECYEKAQEEPGITKLNLAVSALLIKYGEKVAISKGSAMTVKITTPEDIEIFKALLNIKKAANDAESGG
jgi:2-C-methyl-D-erythritol 4-phosphate cytidylyltransferase